MRALSLKLIFQRQVGRGGEIRTHGLYVPNVALYQAKLHPDSLLSSFEEVANHDEPSGRAASRISFFLSQVFLWYSTKCLPTTPFDFNA